MSGRRTHLLLPPVMATLALAMALSWWMMPVASDDMQAYLVPWFGHIAATGMLVLAVRQLLIRLQAPQPDRAAALALLLPSLLLNAGLLDRWDAIWTAACVMALAAALDRRHAAMLAWCGLALGFSAQALLVAPFFLALLINRRVPLRYWPIAPAVAAATMLPGWAAGWPAADFATLHLHQTGTDMALSLNAPNLWAIAQALPIGLPLVGLAFAAAIGATAAYIALFSARVVHGKALMNAALLASLLTAGLLPHMHERSFFFADILALTLALVCRDKAHWTIAILVQAGSMLALLAHVSGIAGLAVLGGVATIVATVRIALPLIRPAANDNPLMIRTV